MPLVRCDNYQIPSMVRLIFDKLPGPDGAILRFIEIDNKDGKSIQMAEWRTRPDGLVELIIGDLSEASIMKSGPKTDPMK